jgi:hypothetical protein
MTRCIHRVSSVETIDIFRFIGHIIDSRHHNEPYSGTYAYDIEQTIQRIHVYSGLTDERSSGPVDEFSKLAKSVRTSAVGEGGATSSCRAGVFINR